MYIKDYSFDLHIMKDIVDNIVDTMKTEATMSSTPTYILQLGEGEIFYSPDQSDGYESVSFHRDSDRCMIYFYYNEDTSDSGIEVRSTRSISAALAFMTTTLITLGYAEVGSNFKNTVGMGYDVAGYTISTNGDEIKIV